MADTRTGTAAKKFVEAIQQDIGEATDLLRRGHTMLDRLASETKGVNGLSALMRGKAQELQKMIDDLTEEAEAVEKKMLGPRGGAEIKQSVNPDLADAAKKARSEGG